MPQLVQAAKKQLSQRIQRVDDKLEQQKEISVQIKDQVGVLLCLKENPRMFQCSFKQQEQIWKHMYCCETSFHELYNELHCQNLIVN
jgi:hypothetical protein